MVDIHILEERNKDKLKELLEQYNIEKTIEELTDTISVYIATDKEKQKEDTEIEVVKRIRLMCTAKIYESYIDNPDKKDYVKTKKVQLYTINNKMLKKLNESAKLSIILNDLNNICTLIKELQYFSEIEIIEENFKFNKLFDSMGSD